MNVWDVFWFLFLFIPLCILWGMTLFDILRRTDLVGWQKAIWTMVIIFFPWIGVFAYLIVRPRNMPMPGEAPYSAQQQYSPQASRTAATAQYSGDARATQ